MPRINQLPATQSVGATDVVAVDTENGTKCAPKSTLFDGYYTAAEVDSAIEQSTAVVDKSSDVVFNAENVDTSKQTEISVYTRGNVCTVHITFYTKIDITSAGKVIATGLPKPPAAFFQFTTMEGLTASGFNPVTLRIDHNGRLMTGYMGNAIVAGHAVRLGYTYVLA